MKPIVIISPWSRPNRNGTRNAKNYHQWQVVSSLLAKDVDVIQVGVQGEQKLEGCEQKFDLTLRELRALQESAAAWASVDNFYPHFVASELGPKHPGVVIWGRSDPSIFGYPWNVNLLLDAKNLRPNQYEWWESEPHDPGVFVPPNVVVVSVMKLIEGVPRAAGEA